MVLVKISLLILSANFMERKKIGNLGEAATILELVKLDLIPYKPIFDNEEIDLLAIFKDKILRINVRSTSTCKDDLWIVTLKNVSRRKDSIVIKKFDNSKFDIVSIFIEPLNKIILLDSLKIKEKTQISININDVDKIWKIG